MALSFSFSRILVMSVTLVLGACATAPASNGLPRAARDKIVSTEVIVPIRQHEVYVSTASSDYTAQTGGGVLFSLADAAVDGIREVSAAAAVKPLRNSLMDFNVDEIIRDEFKKSLSQMNWLGVGDVRVLKDVTNASLSQALSSSKAGAVLFADTDYHLSDDGDALFIDLRASLFANNEMLRALRKTKSGDRVTVENALYHNCTLSFVTRVPSATRDRDHNIANWSANNGAAFRSAVMEGAAALASMLKNDLEQSDEQPAGKPAERFGPPPDPTACRTP